MKRELHCDTMDLYSEFRYQFEISRIHFTKVSVPIFIIKFEKLIIQIESTNKRTHAAQMLPRARTLSRSFAHRRPSQMYTSERAHGRAFAYLQDFQNDWKRTKEICSRTTKSLCLTHNGLSKVFFRAFVTKQIIKWTTVKWARARSTNKQLSKIRTKTTTTITYTHVTC